MDFVVVGFGLGALGVLLGVVLRGWLAARCERAAARTVDPAVAAYERANAAECRGAGQAFLAAGGAVILATVGGLAGALNDRSGALLVATTATVAALGIILWGYLYRSRHPMPPRPHRQKPLASIAGTSVAFDLAAGERPTGASVEAATAEPVAQAPAAASGRDPDAAAEDRDPPAREAAGPFLADPAEAMDGSDTPTADAPPDNVDSGLAEAMVPDEGAAANGHVAGDEVDEDEARVVAFVAHGAGGRPERSAVPDDDGGDER